MSDKQHIIKMLTRVEGKYQDDALHLIAETRKKIARIIHAAARDNSYKITGRNRDKLYAQIDAEYARLEIELRRWSKDLVAEGAEIGADDANGDLLETFGEGAKGGLLQFSRNYAEQIFEIISPENESQLAGVFTTKMKTSDLGALRKIQRDVERQASLEGWSAKVKEREIKDKWDLYSGGMNEARFIDNAGKEWDTKTYVNMLTRTTAQRVSRDGYMESLIHHGDDLVRIAITDTTACDRCLAWDGLILSISGADKDFPSYQDALDAGVFHPNCRCRVERVDPEDDEDEVLAQRRVELPSDLADVEEMQRYNDEGVL